MEIPGFLNGMLKSKLFARPAPPEYVESSPPGMFRCVGALVILKAM